jgi:hypothetical protein
MYGLQNVSVVPDGIWGPVTATLDWCEVRRFHRFFGDTYGIGERMYLTLLVYGQGNYQFSRYIAELTNTLSNVLPISLAFFGMIKTLDHDLPCEHWALLAQTVSEQYKTLLMSSKTLVTLSGVCFGWYWFICIPCNTSLWSSACRYEASIMHRLDSTKRSFI